MEQLNNSAYWLGYARARQVPCRDSTLDKEYPAEYTMGFEDGFGDEQEGLPNPVMGWDASPSTAYEGKRICSFQMTSSPIGRDVWHLYVHDQDLIFREHASQYWEWKRTGSIANPFRWERI